MSEGLGVSIRRSVVSAVTAVLVASVALAGCSDDSDEPPDSGLPSESELTDSTPTSPSTTEPSEPTGLQPPPIPDAASAPGKAGAKAFVAYYIRLLNYASWTGDTKAVRQSSKNCRGCRADATFLEGIYDRGGWIKGGRWSPVPSTWLVLPRHPGWFVALNLDTAKGLQRNSKKSEVKRVLRDRIHRDFHVTRESDGWRITYMEAEL